MVYHNNSKIWDRYNRANSVDPDQTAPKEQSDLGLRCLSFYMHPFMHYCIIYNTMYLGPLWSLF